MGIIKQTRRKKVNIGDKHNNLTLLKRFDVRFVNHQYTYYGLYKCDCGNIKMLLIHNVSAGKTKSCGCLYKISNKNNPKRSGKRIILQDMEQKIPD